MEKTKKAKARDILVKLLEAEGIPAEPGVDDNYLDVWPRETWKGDDDCPISIDLRINGTSIQRAGHSIDMCDGLRLNLAVPGSYEKLIKVLRHCRRIKQCARCKYAGSYFKEED